MDIFEKFGNGEVLDCLNFPNHFVDISANFENKINFVGDQLVDFLKKYQGKIKRIKKDYR